MTTLSKANTERKKIVTAGLRKRMSSRQRWPCFKELVNFALGELFRREKAKGILELEGKVRWEGRLKDMRRARFAGSH